jgi:hypothetical protein
MKKLISYLVFLFLFIFYFIIGHYTGLYIPCIFHLVTGLWCCGCGGTRMFISIFKGNFKQAFYYNQLLFISLPLFIFFYLDLLLSFIIKKEPLYKKVPNWIYYIYIVILIIFMIIRNIFPYFAPTHI